jgi:histidyl-tRNA synthetase
MKDFGGPDICATGFAMGMERLLSVVRLEKRKDEFLYLAYIGDEAKKEAMELARSLRRQGVECLLEFKDRGLKNQLSRASKLEAAWALIIGEEEIRKGRYKLKEMRTGAQKEAGREELLQVLRRSGL